MSLSASAWIIHFHFQRERTADYLQISGFSQLRSFGSLYRFVGTVRLLIQITSRLRRYSICKRKFENPILVGLFLSGNPVHQIAVAPQPFGCFVSFSMKILLPVNSICPVQEHLNCVSNIFFSGLLFSFCVFKRSSEIKINFEPIL